MTVEIETLNDPAFILKHPVTVDVEETSEGCTKSYLVASNFLNVYGGGRTIEEAMTDFQTSLTGLYLCLKDDPDERLTKGAQIMRDRLKEAVQEG